MDVDISDILADVSRPLQHQQQNALRTSLTRTSTDDTSQFFPLDSTTSFADHQLLVRAWTSERCSPAVLPYDGALIDRTMQRIRDQITRIEDLTSGMADPYNVTSTTNNNNNTTITTGGIGGGNGRGGSGSKANTNLVLSILQTDLSRTQFLIRSYLRQRIAKVTKHAAYYIRYCDDENGVVEGRENNHNDTKTPLLSPVELSFLRNHQALLSRLYDDSFLGAFPLGLRRLDDRAGGDDMVQGPDGATVVFVRCLSEMWSNGDEVSAGRRGQRNDTEESATTDLRMRRGEIWVVRWRDIRKGVMDGKLELL